VTKIFLSCALAILIATSTRGGTTQPPPALDRQDSSEAFAKGAKEFENVAGVFISSTGATMMDPRSISPWKACGSG